MGLNSGTTGYWLAAAPPGQGQLPPTVLPQPLTNVEPRETQIAATTQHRERILMVPSPNP